MTQTEDSVKRITFRRIINQLIYDLNKLIRALEKYLTDYINELNITLISEDITDINPQNVLSFNYTNTYDRKYGLNDEIDYDYIHGLAKSDGTLDTNNMVLGIDEYLIDGKENIELDFIEFKKYFQRIHKETGCIYKEWLNKIKYNYYLNYDSDKAKEFEVKDSENTFEKKGSIKNSNSALMKNHLYIFGHSLDVTDKDILKELILCENVLTTIFYHTKENYAQQIANLVKIIGQEEVIKRTGGPSKTISFVKQKELLNNEE